MNTHTNGPENDDLQPDDTRDILSFRESFGEELHGAAQSLRNEMRNKLKSVFEELAWELAMQSAENTHDEKEVRQQFEAHLEAIHESGTSAEEAEEMLAEIRMENASEESGDLHEDDDFLFGDPDDWRDVA